MKNSYLKRTKPIKNTTKIYKFHASTQDASCVDSIIFSVNFIYDFLLYLCTNFVLHLIHIVHCLWTCFV